MGDGPSTTSPDTSPLSAVILTRHERVMLARALTILAAGMDELGHCPRRLLDLVERLQPEGAER